jgi:HAD superfamily hydrolase (TIGR01490 family)
MPTKPVPLPGTAALLCHGPLQDTLEPGFVDLPEIALDTVNQHHRDLLGIPVTQLWQLVHPLFRPLKAQRGSDPLDGVARVRAEVTVGFGDEDNLRFCHALTVSPFPGGQRPAAERQEGPDALTRLGDMPQEKYVAVVTQPAAVPQTGEAAFFDVDNTLMRGASLFHVARKMHQRGAFTLLQAAGFAWTQFKFVTRGENMDDVHAVRDSALNLAAGITVEDVKALGEEVYDEMIASRIWPGAKALAQQHLRVGRRVWLVTATPIEVATVIATRLGLTGALGTVGEVADGMYTGRLVGDILHGSAKAVAVQGIADVEGLDLKRCWAYSDSYNDIPLLTLVGHPVAINPDARLRRHARDNNWPVYDFRSGRRAATLGLKMATAGGAVYGLWRGFSRIRGPRI